MTRLALAQADVETARPGWRTWIGADCLCHALRKSGPPLTARGKDWPDLLDQISMAEALLIGTNVTPTTLRGKGIPHPMSTSAPLTASDDAQRALLGAVLSDAIEWHYDQTAHCHSCRRMGTICVVHDREHGQPIRRYLELASQLCVYEGTDAGFAPPLDDGQLQVITDALGAAVAYREGRASSTDAALHTAYKELAS